MAFTLSACGSDLGEDAAKTNAGAGIPVGAPNATGASFPGPLLTRVEVGATVKKPSLPPVPRLPPSLPPSPFGGGTPGGASPAHPPPRKAAGVNL